MLIVEITIKREEQVILRHKLNALNTFTWKAPFPEWSIICPDTMQVLDGFKYTPLVRDIDHIVPEGNS